MDTIIFITGLIGTISFAASGALTAIERGLDMFGVMIIGCLTAMGGGMLRDICIGVTPPSALVSPEYLALSAAVAIGTFLITALFRKRYRLFREKLLAIDNVIDAVGLAAFSVMGVNTVVTAGYGDNALLVLLLGAMTGVGGGVLRDLCTNVTPAIFRKRIYAVASLAGCAAYYYLDRALPRAVSAAAGMITVCGIRFLATKYKWGFPRISL